MALRPSILSRRANSFDLFLSCFPFLAFCPTEDFRGRLALSRRCIGGSVVDRPGGDEDSIEGKSSRGRFAESGCNPSLY